MPKVIKIIALGVLVILLVALPRLINPYALQIVISTITYSMLGLGFAFTLKVGLPRFDIAAWWGVGAYTTALLMQKANMSFWLTLPIGGIISVLLGWLVFSIAIPRGMMVFLMFGMVLALAMQQLFGSVEFFGGWGGTDTLPQPTIGSFTFTHKPELYYMGLAFLILNLLVYYALYNSKIGRAWNSIGSSIKLASSLGVDVVKYRMANVLIGNFFLAIAGSYFVAYSLVAVPDTFGLANSVIVMMYVIVGGIAYNLSGPIVGALIITFVPQYLRLTKEYEPIITSVVTILLIVLLPMGILGILDRRTKPWFARMKWFKKNKDSEPKVPA
ncbi:MAG: branched-chain amino acid ABC transporter permease [Dehalococcoidales bacterium]